MSPQERINRWAFKLGQRIKPADAERLAKAILTSIDQVSTNRWEAAVQRARTVPGEVRPEKIQALTMTFARELAAAGAGAGAAAAAPMVGTAATVLASTAELAWFTSRAGDLILTVAALHGRPEPSVDERRAWVLAVLIYGSTAREGLTRAMNEANTGLSPATSSRIPITTVQSANRILSKLILKRYGTRRGVVALGTALPLGIGALVGGGANYLAVKALARHADEFFSRLPYSAIDVTAMEMFGEVGPGPGPGSTLR